jgi:DNA-binding CsgD family transcriptional regulator
MTDRQRKRKLLMGRFFEVADAERRWETLPVRLAPFSVRNEKDAVTWLTEERRIGSAIGRLPPSMVRQVVLYGAVGGVLIALLKIIEYKHFVHEYPSEIYGGLVALIFTALGIYFGLRWTRAKEVVVIREVPVRMDGPFTLNSEKLKEVGLTAREHEILGLIAQGLSNREIGEKLFVSENTVKTHSSRMFEKMQVNRRVQAVQKGKDLRLIP